MNQIKIIKSGQLVSYKFDQEYFSIDSPIDVDPHFSETIKNIEDIKLASNELENIIKIHSASQYVDYDQKPRAIVKTEFLQNYYPMILMKSNESLYTAEEANVIRARFKELLLKEINYLQDFYNSIVSTYQEFINKTGFYFFDISSNNIMIDKNFNFKIIDVFSMKKVDFQEKEINPLSVLFYHNAVKHSCTSERALKDKCLKFFNFLDGSLNIEKTINKISLIKSKKIFNRET